VGEPDRLFDIEGLPIKLRLGDVVERPPDRRGVVTWIPGTTGWPPAPFMTVDDYQITHLDSSSTYTVTNNFDNQWRLVPHKEQTARERVWSASLRWKPDRYARDGLEPWEPIPDQCLYEYALLEALIDPDELERMWDYENPTTFDLAIRAARIVEDAEEEAQRLVRAATKRAAEILRVAQTETRDLVEDAEAIRLELAGQVGNLQRLAHSELGLAVRRLVDEEISRGDH
jgi:hypothetical protein